MHPKNRLPPWPWILGILVCVGVSTLFHDRTTINAHSPLTIQQAIDQVKENVRAQMSKGVTIEFLHLKQWQTQTAHYEVNWESLRAPAWIIVSGYGLMKQSDGRRKRLHFDVTLQPDLEAGTWDMEMMVFNSTDTIYRTPLQP